MKEKIDEIKEEKIDEIKKSMDLDIKLRQKRIMQAKIDEIKSKAFDLEIKRHQKIMSGGYIKGSRDDLKFFEIGSKKLAKFAGKESIAPCIRVPHLRHLKIDDIPKAVFSGSFCCSVAVLIVKVWGVGKDKGFCLVADAIDKGIVDQTYYGNKDGPCSVCKFCAKNFYAVDFLYDLLKIRDWRDKSEDDMTFEEWCDGRS